MADITIDDLRALTRPDRPGTCESPFSVVIDKLRHICATDGSAIVGIASAAMSAPRLTNRATVSLVVRSLSVPKEAESASVGLAALKRWCGAVVPPQRDACPMCEENQKRCVADSACLGTGVVNVIQREGVLWSVPIDRALLARFLAPVSGDWVTLAVECPDDAVRIIGPNWRIAVMPIRHLKKGNVSVFNVPGA